MGGRSSSIRQRIQSLNGQIEFFSQAGQRLKVEMEFPLNKEDV